MSVWNLSDYRKISEKLRSYDDVKKISEETGIDYDTLLMIFHQKEVRRIIRLHRKIVKKKEELLEEWEKGASILELSQKENFSPMLMMQVLLAAMNVSKKRRKKIGKNPKMAGNERLEREIREAIESDRLYSPKAHEDQKKRGEKGEKRLFEWLDSRGIEYIKENDIPKGKGVKTPDVLLKNPVKILGNEVWWMDSKASFGDPEEIKRAYRKQFRYYIEIFGTGAVIYWYGYVKTNIPPGLIILESLEDI